MIYSQGSSFLRVGRPVRETKWSWTQANFAIKITVDLEGAGRRSVCWADKTQPISDGSISLDTNHEFVAHQAQPVISNTALGTSRVGDVVPKVCQSSWEVGEGSGNLGSESKTLVQPLSSSAEVGLVSNMG